MRLVTLAVMVIGTAVCVLGDGQVATCRMTNDITLNGADGEHVLFTAIETNATFTWQRPTVWHIDGPGITIATTVRGRIVRCGTNDFTVRCEVWPELSSPSPLVPHVEEWTYGYRRDTNGPMIWRIGVSTNTLNKKECPNTAEHGTGCARP
jgi:hypothetical protein